MTLELPAGRTRTVLLAAALVAGVLVLSVVSVRLRPEGAPTALFWPAAGLAVAATLRARGRTRAGVLVLLLLTTALANAIAGRPPLVAASFGVVNTAEAVVVAALAGRDLRLDGVERSLRFLAAAVAGALVAGVLAGAVVTSTGGTFAPTWWAVACSHGAAVLLMAPVFLQPWRSTSVSRPVRLAETAAVLAATAGVTAWVFAPGQQLPLAFLPMPLVVWAAVRLPSPSAAVVSVVMTTVATAATVAGHGPFAAVADRAGGVATTVTLVQAHAVATAVMVLLVSALMHRRAADLHRVTEAESLYREGWAGSLTGMLVLSLEPAPDGPRLRVVRGNPAAARLLQADSADDLPGQWWCGPVPDDDRAELARVVDDLLEGRTEGWRGELRFAPWLCRLGSGDPVAPGVPHRWMEVSLAHIGTDGGFPRFAAQMHDVSARRDAEDRLRRMALHDDLTGLPNRGLLRDRLDVALAGAARAGTRTGLLLIDLDGFKAVNDTAGHLAGDEVLRTVATRLQVVARASDTVARLGGDEFVVLCGDGADEACLAALAARITDAVREPVLVDGRTHRVGASVGVVLSQPGDDADTVLAHADHDMYRRKSSRHRERLLPAR